MPSTSFRPLLVRQLSVSAKQVNIRAPARASGRAANGEVTIKLTSIGRPSSLRRSTISKNSSGSRAGKR